MKTPVGEMGLVRAFQLKIAGGIAQEPEKLVSGNEELKRARMKFLLHTQWITQLQSPRHQIPRIRRKALASAAQNPQWNFANRARLQIGKSPNPQIRPDR
jgi:hypothetical protein